MATAVQPVLAPATELAFGLTKKIATRHRNVPVQNFDLGLDFGPSASGARLAEGCYVAVQIPQFFELVWDWSDWVFYRSARTDCR